MHDRAGIGLAHPDQGRTGQDVGEGETILIYPLSLIYAYPCLCASPCPCLSLSYPVLSLPACPVPVELGPVGACLVLACQGPTVI